MLFSILIWTAAVVGCIIIWGWWKNGHFKRQGVKIPPGSIPIVGNMMPAMKRSLHFKDFVYQIYNEFPEEKYFGIMNFFRPLLVLRDEELIKQITVKHFDHFTDRSSALDEETDRLFGKTLISLRGQKWRDMRATLSPAFTSSKIKKMFQFVLDCGEQMAEYYLTESNTSKNRVRGVLEVELRDAFSRYANDVIATCAFGLEVNSFVEKNNEFYEMGKDVTDFSGIRFFKAFIMSVFPKVARMFDLQFFSSKSSSFFRNLFWNTVRNREENNILRNDMIQLLMDARKGTLVHEGHEDKKESGFSAVEEHQDEKSNDKRHWTDDEIVAQAMLFFIAGFDTSSTLLCFLAHELALNPAVQKKLQKEIDEVANSNDGKLTYEDLQKMKYMDMVVSETLRMWPTSPITDRKCVKPFTFQPPNSSSSNGYHMEKGDMLWIPLYGIHRDPNIFENPDKFDPERFSDENKHKIRQGTYLPFGIGPRNCIGSRFALMEAKAVIYNLLLRFDFVTTAKTQNPIKMRLDTFSMQAERGFWVGLRPRFKRLLSNQYDEES